MEQNSSIPIHSPLTCEAFAPHIGEQFSLPFDNDITVELELLSATPAKLQSYDGRTLGNSGFVRRDPFALLFRGPEGRMLRQGLYSFRHETLGEFAMSIVPVGPGETGWLYEAVFN